MKISWYIKQLFPLTYWTRYRDDEGAKHFVIWQMWFGHCFNVCCHVCEDNSHHPRGPAHA